MEDYCIFLQSHYPTSTHTSNFMLPIKKRRYLYTADEVNNGMQEDLQKLKRMKLTNSADSIENNYENYSGLDNPCQALIVRPVRVDERVFANAVLADYPKSTLARIINLQLRDTVSKGIDNAVGEGESQALIPYVPLSDMLKEASFEEEHAMNTD